MRPELSWVLRCSRHLGILLGAEAPVVDVHRTGSTPVPRRRAGPSGAADGGWELGHRIDVGLEPGGRRMAGTVPRTPEERSGSGRPTAVAGHCRSRSQVSSRGRKRKRRWRRRWPAGAGAIARRWPNFLSWSGFRPNGGIDRPTFDQYVWAVRRHIVPALGQSKLAELEPKALDRWLGRLGRGGARDGGRPLRPPQCG